jgi:hypothetical protein
MCTLIVAVLTTSSSGIAGLLGLSSSGAALAFQAGQPVQIDVKIVSNNNRTFTIDAPALTTVDCSSGPVELMFGLVGSPRARFPASAGTGIKFINGSGEFGTPQSAGERTIVIIDQCTRLEEFKYDIGVVDPNGTLVILDPVIKNQ